MLHAGFFAPSVVKWEIALSQEPETIRESFCPIVILIDPKFRFYEWRNENYEYGKTTDRYGIETTGGTRR